MLPRTSSAIPIVAPGSRTATPTKRSSTPPPNAPRSPPESPNTLRSLGANAPVFVPRFTTAPEQDVEAPQPTHPSHPPSNDDPFAASYHVQYEPNAYAPYYAPLLPPYGLEPLDFHNYHPSTQRSVPPRPYFMTPALRDELQRKQDAIHQAPFGHPTSALPEEVHAYHSLVPLEASSGQGFFGSFTTSVYKAVNRVDGGTYVLYRVENCRLPHDSALSAIESWSNTPHPSIVRPHEAFTTRAFNDQSLVVVYDYYPLARTLQSQHLAPSTPPQSHSQSHQTSPTKSRAFSPSRNFSPTTHFAPTSPTSQFVPSPQYNSPAFTSPNAFGSPNAGYGFPQSFSAYSFQGQAARTNSLPPSASIAQTLSQSNSFNSFGFSPQAQSQAQFSPQLFSPSNSFSGAQLSNSGDSRGGVPFSQQVGTQPLDERMLWTYLLQLASAVRVAHSRGLAVRCLDPRRVLVTGVGRVRINTVGIVDIMVYDGQSTQEAYFQEDLLSLGSLLLQLCCGTTSTTSSPAQPTPAQSPSSGRNGRSGSGGQAGAQGQTQGQGQQGPAQALARFSPLLRQAVVWLVTPGVGKSIEHLFKEISPAIIGAEMDSMLEHADSLESELSRELENGRLVRLLCKFGFINERPEFDHDPRWAETGDRYIIKLFRDHVFHQSDARGKPVLNLTHVFVNLSKLDAGSEERLMLVSRDERNCLVVSYKEIKTCIESAYRDLSK